MGTMKADAKLVYWVGPVGEKDDFGVEITDVIIDGRTTQGPWALMSMKSHYNHAYPVNTHKR